MAGGDEAKADSRYVNLTWREALTKITSIIKQENMGEDYDGSNRSEDALCSIFQSLAMGNGENDSNTDIPEDVEPIFRLVHLRALIALGHYEEVLSTIDDMDEPSYITMEKAYAMYRLGHYLECRNFLLNGLKSNEESNSNVNGLKYLLAQCHHRLGEARAAFALYSELIEENNVSNANDNCISNSKDYNSVLIKNEEVMTNALAAVVSNHSGVPPDSKNDHSYYDKLQLLNTQTQRILDSHRLGESKIDNNDEIEEYPYDLAYNYGTEILLDSSSMEQTMKALEILELAETWCHSIEDASTIQCNIALAKMRKGDVNGPARTYLELLHKSSSTSSSTTISESAKFAAEHNLAVLGSLKASAPPIDLLKKLPNIDKKSVSTQKRTILYNKALLLLQSNHMDECRTALENLKSAIHRPADNSESKGKKKSKNRNKKKNNSELSQGTISDPNSSTTSTLKTFAPTSTEVESIWWMAKVAIVESELARSCKESSANNSVASANQFLDSAIETIRSYPSKSTHKDFAIALLHLHCLQLSLDSNKFGSEEIIKVLQKSLPVSIGSKPAVIATIVAAMGDADRKNEARHLLHDTLVKDNQNHIYDTVEAELGAKMGIAMFLLRFEAYEEAADAFQIMLEVYENIMNDIQRKAIRSGLLLAISRIPNNNNNSTSTYEKFGDFELILSSNRSIDTVDKLVMSGEGLEAKDVPRLSGGITAVMIERQNKGGSSRSHTNKPSKQDRSTILRKREKRREAYLQKLHVEGRYNYDRPTKPDPERWIPKNQRSYAKRGRRGRHKFIGAQGGGTGAGADKDALRLDAAARALAKAEGKEIGGISSSTPSTAHLSVSSNGPIGRRR
mmetsp:Transcript_2217/g.3109  ORF Transcript_2217/g.3109 Transcript_2217/m.3109 type:complete len:851 (-) Transcript_2217:324-2876(-)